MSIFAGDKQAHFSIVRYFPDWLDNATVNALHNNAQCAKYRSPLCLHTHTHTHEFSFGYYNIRGDVSSDETKMPLSFSNIKQHLYLLHCFSIWRGSSLLGSHHSLHWRAHMEFSCFAFCLCANYAWQIYVCCWLGGFLSCFHNDACQCRFFFVRNSKPHNAIEQWALWLSF